MQKIASYLLSILLSTIYSQSAAQKNFTFGKVSTEELKMKAYEKDSTAGAVILFDIGKLNGDDLIFTRHVRVKILEKSGLDWGNWVFNTPTKSLFKVSVFNLENNEVVKNKLDNNSIYVEEIVEGLSVYKVFAPNVKVGSVIDITYSFTGIPFEWRFQDRIPVIYSRLTLEESLFLKYSKSSMGLIPINTLSSNSWGIEHAPAFKIEPFTNYYGNYISKFVFQINSFFIPQRQFYLDISTSWRNVIENLLKAPNFGGVLNGSNFLNSFAKSLKADNLTLKQKIDTCYSYIQQNLRWNGTKSLFATNAIRSNFLTGHTGNSAEINLSLVTLLNKIGITAYPIVLSTRDNGLLIHHFPSSNRLNYVICYVQHEGLELFIDATSEYCLPGILPMACLNGEGLLVKKDNEQWITLSRTDYTDTRKQFISIKVEADGTAKAKVTQDFIGYGFLQWAEELNQNNGQEIRMNKLQATFPEVKILAFDVKKDDKVKRIATEYIEVDLGNQIIDAGDEFLFNPYVIFDYLQNPLKSETRNCPVDMAVKKEVNVTIVVQLPNELKAEEVPLSVKLHTPDNSASFTFLSSINGSTIQFKLALKIGKHIFTETEYLELRQFFTQVIKTTNTQISLIKS